MGSQKLIQQYPPKGTWKCPGCGKEHVKPHYALPGQIDYTKKPGEEGRVLFNRRNKNDDLDSNMTIKPDMPSAGEQFDEGGHQRSLYCPHCGWEDELTILIRMGDLPDKVDQFFREEQIDPKKTWRKLLSQFLDWLRRREND